MRKRILRQARLAPHRASEGDQRQHDQRNGGDDQAGELWAGEDHHRHGAKAEDEVAQRDRGGRADRRFHLRGVGGKSRHDLAGLRAIEKGR